MALGFSLEILNHPVICDDEKAAQIFTGEKVELNNNELYENVEISISK